MILEIRDLRIRSFSPPREFGLRRSALAVMLLFSGLGGTAFAGPGSYPQIGNIWWGEQVYLASPSQASQIQLYLAPNFTASQAAAVRASNSSAKILTIGQCNGDYGRGAPVVPDSYYLLDVNGNRIKNWPGNPGNFLLNLTNPAVVQFMAQYAAQHADAGRFYLRRHVLR